MKKLLAVLMVSILVFAATACGDQKTVMPLRLL